MLTETESGRNGSGGDKILKYVKELYSSVLLVFSSAIVIALIFTGETKIAKEVHPWVAFVVLWLAIIWLTMVEGGQASCVGLPPVDMNLYKDSHPHSYRQMKIVNRGDNLDRYLMGRQFMVLALVFVENLCGHPLNPEQQLWGMPQWVIQIFLGSGLAMFFMTAMIGKISAQCNASRCMLDYINNYFGMFTLQVARLIEASGLLHCCYVVQMIFARAAGKPLETKEEPRNFLQSVLYWGRVLISAAILGFAFAVTISALWNGQTTMWESIPNVAAIVLFFLFMAIVGMLEGMQIAFFAVAKMSEEERAAHPWAKRTCDVLFARDGRNLPGFMVGRQMCVTLCFFIVARVTTIKLQPGDPNIFGVPDGLQAFFETGLLGALITTIVASITWQLVASAFPMAFLSTPVTYVFLRFCLLLEFTGICEGSWVVARIDRKIRRFKRDEVYIGTAEERKLKKKKELKAKGEEYKSMRVTPGHLWPGPHTAPADTFTKRDYTLDEIHELERDLLQHKQDVEVRMAELAAQKKRLLSGTPMGEDNDVDELELGEKGGTEVDAPSDKTDPSEEVEPASQTA